MNLQDSKMFALALTNIPESSKVCGKFHEDQICVPLKFKGFFMPCYSVQDLKMITFGSIRVTNLKLINAH